MLLPFLLIALPSLGALQLDNEAFHTWMLIAVIPISIYALTLGCKQHKRYKVIILGVLGLTSMILAVSLGHEVIGDIGEKFLTLLGATLIVIAHWGNFKRCRQPKICSS
jgi:hypothetical protein